MAGSPTKRFLKEYSEALYDDSGAIFVGAGVSMSAGYPSWTTLLREIGDELGVNSSDIYDLAALAQWSIQESGGATRVRNVIREQIAPELEIPEALKIVARLPVRHIWTTNYDRLIERSFDEIGRPIDPVSGAKDLALKAMPGATRLYKMHGSVDRLDDVVISTDDYELFRSRRGAYLPLLQAQLTSMSMLFVGLSFTDPNIRHVLSLIRESFTDAPPEHFAIVRPPEVSDFKSDAEFDARLAQHKLWVKDLRRYGLSAIEIEDFGEVPDLLRQVERRVAARRVWISGSWPLGGRDIEPARLYSIAESIGLWIGRSGYDLVSGVGELVGSAAISGFLNALIFGGGWDLERRLIARPFPQPLKDKKPDRAQWTALRTELARQAGVVIFLGGAKFENDKLISSSGVKEEFELAKKAGAFLIPVGSTGGASQKIAEDLVGSTLPYSGVKAVRPTDEELKRLSDKTAEINEIIDCVTDILERILKPPHQ